MPRLVEEAAAGYHMVLVKATLRSGYALGARVGVYWPQPSSEFEYKYATGEASFMSVWGGAYAGGRFVL